jgi:serine/threonine protein phosphatase PrpC
MCPTRCVYAGSVGGRASIVGAAETSIGKVRDHNEDAHFIDPEAGIFIVCDGMGGHAAGEVASALAVKTIRQRWAGDAIAKASERWLKLGTADARKMLMQAIQRGVLDAHDAIVDEAERDRGKAGMGTTLVGGIIVGGDMVFTHCGDSRAYLVRDGIAMQLTEDHTLLARLLAAGVDVDVDGDGLRFKSMLTNALGIGQECKVSTFVVPLADGDRFLLCSDGITEYVQEHEIGEALSTSPSPARAAQRLVDMALDRGGGDNATALVVRVLEAGETARPSELLRRENQAIHACPLWAKVNPQQRLRALRIALPRDYPANEKVPAQTLGDRVAWIIVEGELVQDGIIRGPGSLLYPEALLADRPLPDKEGLAVARTDVRTLALRADDFRELCDDDPELGQALLDALGDELALRRPHRRTGRIVVQSSSRASSSDFGIEETLPGAGAGFPRAPSNPDIPIPDLGARPSSPDLGRKPTNPDVRAKLPDRAARAPTLPPTFETGATIPPPIMERASTEPPSRPSSPRVGRGSQPPSSLIAPPIEVEGDLDRALTDLTAAPKQLAPADDEDAEIVVEAKSSQQVSEPEISIERLEDEAAKDDSNDDAKADGAVVEVLKDTSSQKITMTDHSEPEIIVEPVVEPLVAADSGPHHPRPRRSTDAPE